MEEKKEMVRKSDQKLMNAAQKIINDKSTPWNIRSMAWSVIKAFQAKRRFGM